jgi:MSHA pilin protein MshC
MNAGYSLIELVVTITVATILAAVAIPFFSQGNVEATWFNEQAKAAVRYAQRQAVAQRRSVYVNVTATTITICYNAPPGCASPVLDLATGAAYSVVVPAGVSISAANFSFNGLGQPNPIAGVSFTAGSAIAVAAETGFVQ